MRLGYCLNVHPGETLDEVCRALEGPVAGVRKLSGEIGVGIYLAAKAAEEVLADEGALARLKGALEAADVSVFTANAFPAGGFHGERVKRSVYRPTWNEVARRDYTITVACCLAELLPRGAQASISTSPISFRAFEPPDLEGAGALLGTVAVALERLARETEREIAVAIEPEPLCTVERASELVRFLEAHVFSGPGRDMIAQELRGVDAEAIARRRIGACLDACHHAVVFEEIEDALSVYAKGGVRVVKAQLSSALEVKDVESLRAFDEPRYLHQTFWKAGSGIEFAEDINGALSRAKGASLVRSHFHVPLAWGGDEKVGTTRPLLEKALPLIVQATSDLEIETYTWSVLPGATRERFQDDVSAMVAAEIEWVRGRLPG